MPQARLVRLPFVFSLAVVLLGGCNAEGTSVAVEETASPPISVRSSFRTERALETACPAGRWPDAAGACVPVEEAFIAEGGHTYWVDQQHGLANDRNPGTRERPWRTISRASTVLGPGDAVIVQAGTYREAITPRIGGSGSDRRITYAAAPGAEVIVSGADVTAPEEWIRDGNAWRRVWTGPELPAYSSDPVLRREMVVVGGEVLRAVFRREDLVPGAFFVEGSDTAQRAVLVRFQGDVPPAGAGLIEVAHRTFLFQPMGENPYPECGEAGTPGWLRIVGFTFRHAANRAQWGAFCGGSEGALVENVTVEWTNGAGVDGSGRNHVFRNVAANYNGQIGFVASCENCLFEDSEAIGNNWKGHNPFWEAGGGKWHDTHQTVFRRHFAADNGGPGIWLDGNNTHNTIEGSVAIRNEVAGIMLELETMHTLVQHNYIADNRWRGYSGAGILLQAASHNALIHNTIVRNEGGGIWLRLDPHRRAEDGHNILYNNVLLGNAWTASEEAREIVVHGRSLAHSRTNRLEGNVYGRHAVNDLRTSTFFFIPDDAREADFRSGDLSRWQQLIRGDNAARIIDPRPEWMEPGSLPVSIQGGAVPAARLDVFGARAAQNRLFGSPGANAELLPRGINLSPR